VGSSVATDEPVTLVVCVSVSLTGPVARTTSISAVKVAPAPGSVVKDARDWARAVFPPTLRPVMQVAMIKYTLMLVIVYSRPLNSCNL
jgi:hypothetical protein